MSIKLYLVWSAMETGQDQ